MSLVNDSMENSSDSSSNMNASDTSCSKLPLDVLSIFICKSCNTVLADGKSVCAMNDILNIIAFLRVTKHVNLISTLCCTTDSELEACTYYNLHCRCCEARIGLVLQAADRPFAYLLQLYCLFKNQILCYLLKTKSIVQGDDLHFDFARCSRLLYELQTDMAKTHQRIQSLFIKRQRREGSPKTPDTDHSMLDSSEQLKNVDNSDASCSQCPAQALSIFMCKTCNTVLGDGKNVCEINKDLKIIAFLRVTKHVVRSLSIEYSGSGELKECAFFYLICLTCASRVGLILHIATRPLTYLKDLYCLFSDQILCYLLKTKTIVQGDNLHFDFTRFSLLLDQLQTDLIKTQNRIESLYAKRQKRQGLPETHYTVIVE